MRIYQAETGQELLIDPPDEYLKTRPSIPSLQAAIGNLVRIPRAEAQIIFDDSGTLPQKNDSLPIETTLYPDPFVPRRLGVPLALC